MYSCCDWPGAASEQIHHAVELGGRQLVAVQRRQHLGLGCRPATAPATVRRWRTAAPGGGLRGRASASFSTRASRRQTQLLCRPKQLGDLDLGQAVLAHQGVDDPGFFPLLGAAAGLVEPVDGGLGRALVGLQEPGTEGLQPRARAAASRLKPSRTSWVSSRRQTTTGVSCP